jgi:hypothetical protein
MSFIRGADTIDLLPQVNLEIRNQYAIYID